VIVRLMGEGQFQVDEGVLEELQQLDDQASRAVEEADEESLRSLLATMAKTVRDRGERLPDADLSASDAIIPPEDLTLDEARELFEGEGLIPDLPVA
jgi:hypothetical protein